jgi:NodT family efflux transporter outer membrane factor (OMF) lipoprotein
MIRTRLFPGLAALALTGCTVGPKFVPPPAPVVDSYTRLPLAAETGDPDTGAVQHFVQGGDVPGRWWTLYQSPALDALVDRALMANPDVESAQAALRSMRETYLAQRAARYPTVDGSYNLQRQQANRDTLAPLLSSNNDLFSLSTAQLNVAYDLDIFGGVKRQAENSLAQADAQRFQTEAAYLTLTTNVVNAAVQIAMLRDQMTATQAIIKSDRDVVDIMQRQQTLGEIGRGDVANQEAALAQAQQTLPPLEKQLAQAEDLLADLIGGFPSEILVEPVSLASLKLPTDLPLSLPAKLVQQRPDVKAAEANLHAASALVGVAIAARLPDISLAANAGGTATNVTQMFNNGNLFWAASGNVAQTIFDAGALKHRQHAAEANFDQAKAQYSSTVLSAFQNVADTLQAIKSDSTTFNATVASERRTAESAAIAKRQFELGEVTAVVALNAELAHQQTLVTRIQADASRYADTTALFQALGGGWWNRSETAINTK